MKYFALFISLYCLSGQAQAAEILHSFSIDIGQSKENIDILRIGLQRDFGRWLEDKKISLTGYFELSLNYWNGTEEEVYGIAFSPVFRLHLFNGHKVQPYIEGGVGVSLISETTIDALNLSSSFQFEDRIGFMVNAGDINFHIKYMHYSNASLKEPNHGIDLFLIGVSYQR